MKQKMNALGRYANSGYVSASNALGGKTACRKVVAYVESYDDIFFWRSILSHFETPQLRFVVTLPSHNRKLERGKKAALISALRGNMGPNMIACVDADYDYLRQGCNQYSRVVIDNPYVFHTYAYSIENLQCWAPSLHDVCVMVTLNDSPDIPDFETILASYSKIIYPLFVWSVLCCRDSRCGKFDISDFMLSIKTGSIAKNSVGKTLDRVGHKVRTSIHRLEGVATEETLEAYHLLDKELSQLGIVPEETYLYIQGHQLFNEVVVPMLTSVCNSLVRQRENEIHYQSRHNTQRRNEISCYEHSLEDVSSMLKKNTRYLLSPQVKRIMNDLHRFLENNHGTEGENRRN